MQFGATINLVMFLSFLAFFIKKIGGNVAVATGGYKLKYFTESSLTKGAGSTTVCTLGSGTSQRRRCTARLSGSRTFGCTSLPTPPNLGALAGSNPQLPAALQILSEAGTPQPLLDRGRGRAMGRRRQRDAKAPPLALASGWNRCSTA